MEQSMFDTLLELPLFQGLGKNDLTRIVEEVRFDFVKCEQGQVIASQDSPCNQLIFLLKGSLTRHTLSSDRTYSFSERISAPAVLQPESLYGLYRQYTHSYTVRSSAQLIKIDKSAINNTFINYEVFRLNLINLLSTRIIRSERALWDTASGNTEQRIIRFIRQHVEYPAGEKILNIKMEDLAQHLNETRINISKALNHFQDRGLVLLRRKEIIIPALEKLLVHYNP